MKYYGLSCARLTRLGASAFAAMALLMFAGAPAADAQEDLGFFGYGGRAGFSVDPDQFTIGAYAKLGKVTQLIKLRPSVDLGFGNDLVTFIGNADLQYDFNQVEGPYLPFVGAGLGIGYVTTTIDLPPGVDDSSTDIGVNIYGGVEKSFSNYMNGYVEMRVGVEDMPDLKFTVGFGWF